MIVTEFEGPCRVFCDMCQEMTEDNTYPVRVCLSCLSKGVGKLTKAPASGQADAAKPDVDWKQLHEWCQTVLKTSESFDRRLTTLEKLAELHQGSLESLGRLYEQMWERYIKMSERYLSIKVPPQPDVPATIPDYFDYWEKWRQLVGGGNNGALAQRAFQAGFEAGFKSK